MAATPEPYDVVIKMRCFADLLDRCWGWPVQVKNSGAHFKNSQSVRVALIGDVGVGKTKLYRALRGVADSSATSNIEDLLFGLSQVNLNSRPAKSAFFLDARSFGKLIPKDAFLDTFRVEMTKRACAKQHITSAMNRTVEAAADESARVDHFVQKVAIDFAHICVFVVDSLARSIQLRLAELFTETQRASKKLIIVYNLTVKDKGLAEKELKSEFAEVIQSYRSSLNELFGIPITSSVEKDSLEEFCIGHSYHVFVKGNVTSQAKPPPAEYLRGRIAELAPLEIAVSSVFSDLAAIITKHAQPLIITAQPVTIEYSDEAFVPRQDDPSLKIESCLQPCAVAITPPAVDSALRLQVEYTVSRCLGKIDKRLIWINFVGLSLPALAPGAMRHIRSAVQWANRGSSVSPRQLGDPPSLKLNFTCAVRKRPLHAVRSLSKYSPNYKNVEFDCSEDDKTREVDVCVHTGIENCMESIRPRVSYRCGVLTVVVCSERSPADEVRDPNDLDAVDLLTPPERTYCSDDDLDDEDDDEANLA